MKQIAVGITLFAVLVLAGCGGGNSSQSGTVNGNWTASLMDNGTSTPVFAFTTVLSESTGSSLNVTQFKFTSSSPCFVSGETETGGFSLTGDFNGNVKGAFQMAVQSGNPSGNTLTLQGTANGNTITGTWILSGVSSGCTGSGNFTMTRM
jgi:hypothetical protein